MKSGQARFVTAAGSASTVEDGIEARAEARGAGGSTRPSGLRSPGQEPPPWVGALDPEATREYGRLVLFAQRCCSAWIRCGVAVADEIAHEAAVGYFLAVQRGTAIQDSQAYMICALRRMVAKVNRVRSRSRNSPLEVAREVAAAAPPVDDGDIDRLLAAVPSHVARSVKDSLSDATDGELAQRDRISVDAVRKRRLRAHEWIRDVFLACPDEATPGT